MRVLHLCSGDLWAGAEVAVFHLARELAQRRGHETAALLLNDGRLAAGLSSSGIRTWVVPETTLPFQRILHRSLAIVREWRPDVIHSHRYKENVLGSVLAAVARTGHIRTLHGLNPALAWNGGLAGIAPLLDGALSDWTGSDWIVVSDDLARSVRGMRRRVAVVPNGIPLAAPEAEREKLDDAFGGPGPACYVGFVGRLEPVKRPDRFLRIVAGLPGSVGGRSVRGVVLGDGGLAPELRELAARLGISSRIRFLGHRDDSEALVAALDILVIPSDHEGVPMVLLEAMRSGVPLVASRVGGIPEVLGDCDWLIPPDDEVAMVRAVEALLEDRPRRDAWSRFLRERFAASCSVAVMADRVLDVYRSVTSAS